MTQKRYLYLAASLLLIGLISLTGCQGSKADPTTTPFIEKEEEDPFIGVPNPASFYCQEMGYELEMRETEQGTEGICVFPDDSECEEWDFLAGRCGNPWSFCQRQGYSITQEDDIAVCTFPGGSSCPEYEFFIQECGPE